MAAHPGSGGPPLRSSTQSSHPIFDGWTVTLEPLELFANIRQGMKVIDSNGDVVGQVRDLSQRSVLVMEVEGTRVFWIDGGEVLA